MAVALTALATDVFVCEYWDFKTEPYEAGIKACIRRQLARDMSSPRYEYCATACDAGTKLREENPAIVAELKSLKRPDFKKTKPKLTKKDLPGKTATANQAQKANGVNSKINPPSHASSLQKGVATPGSTEQCGPPATLQSHSDDPAQSSPHHRPSESGFKFDSEVSHETEDSGQAGMTEKTEKEEGGHMGHPGICDHPGCKKFAVRKGKCCTHFKEAYGMVVAEAKRQEAGDGKRTSEHKHAPRRAAAIEDAAVTNLHCIIDGKELAFYLRGLVRQEVREVLREIAQV